VVTFYHQGFHKITFPDGSRAELNRGSGGALCFLWSHDSEGRGDPIVDICILYEDEKVPPDFSKISRNVLKGSGKEAYICYKRDKDVDPIGSIRVLYGDQKPGS